MRLRNIPAAAAAIESSEYCVLDYDRHRGEWRTLFENDHPLAIEIGMGKGKFLMELAALHPDINYIGIERYGSVLYRALQKMENQLLPNIRFLCVNAEALPELFAEGEINMIYLNFSDPWPKDRHAKRRLTSREFLARYDKVLKKDGCLEFKTDNRLLFDFSLEEVNAANWSLDTFTYDLHHDAALNTGNILTEYEEKFAGLGNPICKMVISRQISLLR